MTIIVYIIRDHFIVSHSCNTNDKNIELLVGNNPRPNPNEYPKDLFFGSCGLVAEYYAKRDMNLKCKYCGKTYTLGRREIELAKKSFDEFFEKLKEGVELEK